MEKVRPKMKGVRRSQAEIAKAVKAAGGNLSAVARAMHTSRSWVHRRITKSAALSQLVSDQRETLVDNAETALSVATLQGEAWAVCFTLKCLGKDRGYIERGEVSHDVKLVVSHAAEDLTDEQLAAIASRAIASRGSQRLAGPADGPEEPD